MQNGSKIMKKKIRTRPVPPDATPAGINKKTGQKQVRIKLKDGSYAIRRLNANGMMLDESKDYYAEKEIDGIRRSFKLCSSKEASQVKWAKILERINNGEIQFLDGNGEDKPLDKVVEAWLDAKEAGDRSEYTIGKCKGGIRFILKELGIKHLKDIMHHSFPDKMLKYQQNTLNNTKTYHLPKGDEFSFTQLRHILGLGKNGISLLVRKAGLNRVCRGRECYLSRQDAEKLLAHRGKASSPRTINMNLGYLEDLMNYMHRQRIIKTVPRVPQKLPERFDIRKKRRALTLDQLNHLVATTIKENTTNSDITAFERATLYQTAFYTMMRCRALKELEVKDCHLDGDTPYIYVRPETDKCRVKRSIPIPLTLAASLKTVIGSKAPNKRVWQKWIKDMAMLVLRDLEAANIPRRTEDGDIDFHSFRHSGATYYLSKGADYLIVKEMGGWKKLDQLVNTYSHLNHLNLRDNIGHLLN